MVHNFSSYTLTDEEMRALAYGLDNLIPTNIKKMLYLHNSINSLETF